MITIEKTFPGTIAYPLERLGDPEKLVFFDIETTGFSADYNIVYLIGCIWPEGDHLRFIQWFVDTKAAEADVLTAFFPIPIAACSERGARHEAWTMGDLPPDQAL